MRRLLLLIAVLLLVPAAAAQSRVYISHYGANYTLVEDGVSVSERVTFKNEGDTFRETIFLLRGDAQDVKVSIDKTHIWKSDYIIAVENGVRVVRFPNLVIAKGATRELSLDYTRTDLLGRKDSLYVFSGSILASLPWNTLEAEIGVLAPEGYQFGGTSLTSPVDFEVLRAKEGRRDVVRYRIPNLPKEESVRAELEYADFESLTLELLSLIEGYVDDALLEIGNANKTIENARARGADAEAAASMYGEAVNSLNDAEERMREANDALRGEWAGFKGGYESALAAQRAAKDAQSSALGAVSEANFAIQRALEKRIEEMGSNLTKESEARAQSISQRLEEMKELEKPAPPPAREVGADRVRYLIEILVLALIAFVALTIARAREQRLERMGRVDDFRVIDDLKRKEFKGFDRKVDKVKKGVEIAKEIRKLRGNREKYVNEIEARRKEMVAGKLPKEDFDKQKKNLGRKIERVDSKVDALEEELKQVREVK